MPFGHVAPAFQPEQLDNLTEAFNLVWPQIMLANRAATDIELEGLRQRLANFIVACASRGEFDPARLRDTAFRAFQPTNSMKRDGMAEALPPAYPREVPRLA